MSFFVFSSRRRHTRLVSDWSSDVCSSDLTLVRETAGIDLAHATEAELRGALKRKDIADVGTLSGAKLVDEVFKNFVEPTLVRSEERRVGKEWRAGWWREDRREKYM